MQKIHFQSADRKLQFPGKTELKQFIEQIFTREKKKLGGLHYVFCSDEFLLEINKTYLQHDYFTDIITFDLSEKAPSVKTGSKASGTKDCSPEIEGEIYVSLDRIKDNAQSLKTSLREETLRVLFHGALHLCGYKDKTKEQINEMRLKEEFYIHLYRDKASK